ncbi:hypothetical protein BDZ94DRAFT_1172481, partial [Collybia nuda]
IAGAANVNLEVQEGLSTSELTKEAFKELGEDGIIRIASDHACGESDNSMDVDYIDTKMAVVDGTVTGPQKFAIDGCTTDVVNLQGGVFYAIDLAQYGHMCHIRNCQNLDVDGTCACREHPRGWRNGKI